MKFPHQFIRVGSGQKFTHLQRVGSDRVSNISGRVKKVTRVQLCRIQEFLSKLQPLEGQRIHAKTMVDQEKNWLNIIKHNPQDMKRTWQEAEELAADKSEASTCDLMHL